jgi:hypothetical protein
MYSGLPLPKHASGLDAALATLASGRFLELARTHNLAAELGSEQMARAFAEGTFPVSRWQSEADLIAANQLKEIRRVLLRSFLLTSLIAAVALTVLVATGNVNTALPPDYGKSITAAGVATAAWGSLIQLRPVEPTFRRNFLHEVAQGFIVKALIGLGLFFSAVGALWWQ